MTAVPSHLRTVTLRYCPKCGRTDRFQDFGRGQAHYNAGRRCDGTIVRLVYRFDHEKEVPR